MPEILSIIIEYFKVKRFEIKRSSFYIFAIQIWQSGYRIKVGIFGKTYFGLAELIPKNQKC
jgi:hypothetical protein